MSENWPAMGLSQRAAEKIVSLRRRTIMILALTAFAVVYIPLWLTTFLLDYYPHVVDTLVVPSFVTVATVLCVWVAWLRVPWFEPAEAGRRGENRGWLSLAAGSALVLTARLVYAVDELFAGDPTESIALADAMFGLSFVFFVAGLLTFPWSSGDLSRNDALINAGTVTIVVGTILWPLLIGPIVDDEFAGAASIWTITSFLAGIIIMTFSALWMLMRGVRHELHAVAITLAAAVGSMVVIQVGYLGFTSSSDASDVQLLFINTATSLAFLQIGLAALLRLHVTGVEEDEEVGELASFEQPVHRRQIMLPYPLIAVLLFLRLGMEVFEWRLDYTEPMIVGSVFIVALLMYRQFQLLRYNDRLYEQVAGASIRDGLTRLYNHRAMHEILRKQAAQADRSGRSLAVIFLDVDRFKHYNDTYGHRQGDGLLTSISELLLDRCRESDYVGRYGGEEFMVIAPDASAEDACRLGERLRTGIEGTQYVHNGTRSAVTISVGIALYPDDGEHVEDVINRADQAMYQAKSAGRNQTVLFQPA